MPSSERITASQPIGTFRADIGVTGEAFIPSVFADNFRIITASLDWSRVWEGHGDRRMVAQELREAARYAEALARQCEHFAKLAEVA